MDGMQKARLILGFFDADPAAGAPASAVLARVEALFGEGERAYVERYRDPAVRVMRRKGVCFWPLCCAWPRIRSL